MLLSLARDLIDARNSSLNREALGLVRGGATARAGRLALAPWEPALRRAAILVAGALLAMVLGSAATWIREPAWPGWTWSATVAAPALVLAGHLTGRRGPVAGGALLLLVAVRLVLQALDAVPVNRVGGVGFNALALCIAFVTAAALVALSVRLARRERDPAGLLAMSLAVGALLPVAAFYGASTLLIDERATLAAWVASALGIAIAMRSLVRRSVVAT